VSAELPAEVHALADAARAVVRSDTGLSLEALGRAVDAFDAFDGVLVLTDPLPEGLTYRDGRLWFDCAMCGQPTDWPEKPEDFDPENTILLCGGSPRCCP
jgi:hypothetical protein